MFGEPLTPAQLQQLRILAEAGATRSERSKPLELLRPATLNVLEILKRRQLVASKSARGFTEYWLTAAGVAAVRDHHSDNKDQAHG